MQLSSGRLYERGQLDLLCLLELTNQSLQLLREERRRLAAAPGPAVGAAPLQDARGQMSRALQSLQLLRYVCHRHAADGRPSGPNWHLAPPPPQEEDLQGRHS